MNPLVMSPEACQDIPSECFPRDDVVIATALSSALGTLIASMIGNLPFVVAPGIGLSTYYASGLVLTGMHKEVALATVVVSGVLTILLSVTKVLPPLLLLLHSVTKVMPVCPHCYYSLLSCCLCPLLLPSVTKGAAYAPTAAAQRHLAACAPTDDCTSASPPLSVTEPTNACIAFHLRPSTHQRAHRWRG